MRIPDDVIESLDQNGIDVSSAWLRCDVDVYNELYGSPLVQPVSLEAATLNELRFLVAAGTITIRMTDNPNSLVIYSSYVEFVDDGTGGSDGQTVAVDDVTIDWNNASQLEVKDAGITADKLAPGAVTNAKFADAPASTLKGRARGAGSGPVSDLTGTSVRPIVGDGWAGDQALVSDAIAGLVESVTTATEISYVHGVTSPIQTQLSSQSVHNNLSGLQGGVSGEYYHLTAAQATTVGALTGWATKAYTNGSTTDVAEGTNLYFTNARADARITAQKGVASGLATLDVGGKVPLSQLPATTIVETFVVASQAAMLALAAQQGDVCVRTDLSKTYILKTDPASTLANWQELLSPVDGVQSVGLSATGPLTVSGSPVTSSGTLALGWGGSASDLVRADGSTVVATTYMAVSSYPDLVAIEALAGTSGLLKKTAANTWTLDTASYLTTATADATSRAANTVYAAPNGSAGVASFRALVAADIPSLDAAKLTSGTLGYARGGTGISAPGATAGNLRWSGSAYSIDSSVYALASAIPAASSATPAALGTAAVGTGTTWARADHVHAMPTAEQVGAVPSSSGVVGLTLPSSTSFASSFTQDIFGTTAKGYFLREVRTKANAPSSLLGNYSAGLAWKGDDTYGSLMVAYNSSDIRVSGGNGSDPVWTVDLWHTGNLPVSVAGNDISFPGKLLNQYNSGWSGQIGFGGNPSYGAKAVFHRPSNLEAIALSLYNPSNEGDSRRIFTVSCNGASPNAVTPDIQFNVPVTMSGSLTGSAKLSSLVVEGRAVISFAGSASMPSGYAVGSIVTVVGGSGAPGVFYSEAGTTFEYSSKTSGFVDGTNVIAMGNLCFQFVKRSATVWRMIGLHPV